MSQNSCNLYRTQFSIFHTCTKSPALKECFDSPVVPHVLIMVLAKASRDRLALDRLQNMNSNHYTPLKDSGPIAFLPVSLSCCIIERGSREYPRALLCPNRLSRCVSCGGANTPCNALIPWSSLAQTVRPARTARWRPPVVTSCCQR